MRITTSANASSRPWISSSGHRRDRLRRPRRARAAGRRRARRARSPRDALTSTTSPGRERGEQRRRAPASRSGDAHEPVGAAARRRARPSAMPRAPPSPDDAPAGRTTAAAASPDLAVARVVAVAQLEHLAEHRDVAAGQPGQQLQRRGDRRRRGVVGVVDDRDAAGRMSSPRCGADQPPARRRRDRVGGHARRRARRPRPPARCGRRAGRASGCAHVVASAGGVGAGSASRPRRRFDVVRARRRRRRRSRRSAIARGVRAAIRRTRGSSALRTATPSGRAAPRRARPSPARSRRSSRSATGAPAGPRSRRRSRPADRRQLADLAADVHAHLEDRRLVLRAQPRGPSAAARSRCSGCPRS